jgi:hypothetical protein
MFSTLFPRFGAAEWHGRNLDVLAGSISGGSDKSGRSAVEIP